MQSKLCLHAGGYATDLETVSRIITPAATTSHFPISHTAAIDLVSQSLLAGGYQITDQAHALAKAGNRYFGLFEVRHPGLDGGDHALIVGLRNSHDRAFRMGLSMGSRVFICDNLAFAGEVVIGRKHTTNIMRDLPRLVAAGVGKLDLLGRYQEGRFARYKAVGISNETANDLLIRSWEAGVLPITKLPLAIEEWKTPRHAEFRDAGPTLWRLYNALTEAVKGRAEPVRLATPAIHGIFDSAAGFTDALPVVIEADHAATAV